VDAVTAILLDRSHQADTISRMVVLSFAAHAAIIAAIAIGSLNWRTPPDASRVMTISLAGAPGPVQGHNPESAKPVQQKVPPTTKPQPEAPPSLQKPEMVEPLKTTKATPKPKPPPPVKQDEKPTEQLHGRTPTQGAEVTPGTARFETHSTAQTGFGLATGGGGTGGAETDYKDFCCPEYLQAMTRLIYGNWQQHQGQDGSNKLEFTVMRDGTITDVTVEQGANAYLNLASERALKTTQKLPPLPAAFTGDHLTVHLGFQYKR
jgi:TonB family protein